MLLISSITARIIYITEQDTGREPVAAAAARLYVSSLR